MSPTSLFQSLRRTAAGFKDALISTPPKDIPGFNDAYKSRAEKTLILAAFFILLGSGMLFFPSSLAFRLGLGSWILAGVYLASYHNLRNLYWFYSPQLQPKELLNPPSTIPNHPLPDKLPTLISQPPSIEAAAPPSPPSSSTTPSATPPPTPTSTSESSKTLPVQPTTDDILKDLGFDDDW